MRKGLTIGQKRIILILGGFLIFLGAFLLIFQKNMEKVNKLEADTSEKTSQVDYLSNLQILVNKMKATTEKSQKEILTHTQKYPCKMTQQKVISNLYNWSVASGIRLQSISPGPESTFFKNGKFTDVGGEEGAAVAEGESENAQLSQVEKNPETKVSVDQMIGKITSYAVQLSGTRKQILKAVDWITGNSEPMSLSAINLSFDSSTGRLNGSMTVNFFSLNGNGKPYVEPDISGIILGNEDVFGTFKK